MFIYNTVYIHCSNRTLTAKFQVSTITINAVHAHGNNPGGTIYLEASAPVPIEVSTTIQVRIREYVWDYNEGDDVLQSETYKNYTCTIPAGETKSNVVDYSRMNSGPYTYECKITEYSHGSWASDSRFVVGTGF